MYQSVLNCLFRDAPRYNRRNTAIFYIDTCKFTFMLLFSLRKHVHLTETRIVFTGAPILWLKNFSNPAIRNGQIESTGFVKFILQYFEVRDVILYSFYLIAVLE